MKSVIYIDEIIDTNFMSAFFRAVQFETVWPSAQSLGNSSSESAHASNAILEGGGVKGIAYSVNRHAECEPGHAA